LVRQKFWRGCVAAKLGRWTPPRPAVAASRWPCLCPRLSSHGTFRTEHGEPNLLPVTAVNSRCPSAARRPGALASSSDELDHVTDVRTLARRAQLSRPSLTMGLCLGGCRVRSWRDDCRARDRGHTAEPAWAPPAASCLPTGLEPGRGATSVPAPVGRQRWRHQQPPRRPLAGKVRSTKRASSAANTSTTRPTISPSLPQTPAADANIAARPPRTRTTHHDATDESACLWMNPT
jgi:hypothetical protein